MISMFSPNASVGWNTPDKAGSASWLIRVPRLSRGALSQVSVCHTVRKVSRQALSMPQMPSGCMSRRLVPYCRKESPVLVTVLRKTIRLVC